DDRSVVRRRSRQQLVHADAPVRLVEDDVGEGPPDIHAHPRATHLRFAIANCIAAEHRASCPSMEAPMTPIAPLEERESVEHLVARTLRDLIVDGKLPEGTPLVQRELAQQLGVSPTPGAAGLSPLEREGFVVVTPTGRALVRRLTREDFEEIYAARLGLEGLAARLGAYAVGREDIARMKVTLRDLRRLRAT